MQTRYLLLFVTCALLIAGGQGKTGGKGRKKKTTTTTTTTPAPTTTTTTTTPAPTTTTTTTTPAPTTATTTYTAGERPGDATDTHSCDFVRGVPAHLRLAEHMGPDGLGDFYQKYTEAYGIPILGSPDLPDSALQRACYVVRFVLADSYAVRNHYYKNFGRFALMAVTEVTTDIPEHTSLGEFWDTRARGLGATMERPVSTGAEENALCYPDDPYIAEDIGLHEFVHGVHVLGLSFAVSDFDFRLRAVYESAKAAGLWSNTYAITDMREYFAEGVQSYFGVEAYANPPDGIHNDIDTRAKLLAYDPDLHDFIQEVFSCGNDYIKRCDNDRGCVDENPRYCPYWASTGECEIFPDYMLVNCKRSCQACCVDDDPNCPYWASVGECENSPGFMLESCKKSCLVCCGDEAPSSYCLDWASRGYCENNPDYMLEWCKESCGQCQDPGPGDCVDDDQNCPYWASVGECENNPGFMLVWCKKSCLVC